jgi:hypothetical protein
MRMETKTDVEAFRSSLWFVSLVEGKCRQKCSEVKCDRVKCSEVKCGWVKCSEGLSNRVPNIVSIYADHMK